MSRKSKFTIRRATLILVLLIFISGCNQNTEKQELNNKMDLATLEKEIVLRLREYENHLKNGDSIALGNMYMINAEIIPSTVGRQAIIESFRGYVKKQKTP